MSKELNYELKYINRDAEALEKRKEEARKERDENRGDVFLQVKKSYISNVLVPSLVFLVICISLLVGSKLIFDTIKYGSLAILIVTIPAVKIILTRAKRMLQIPEFADFIGDKIGPPEIRLHTFLNNAETVVPVFNKQFVNDKLLVVPMSLKGKTSAGIDTFFYFDEEWFVAPHYKDEVVIDFSDRTIFCPEFKTEEISEENESNSEISE